MGAGRSFSRGSIVDFPGGSKNDFSRGSKGGEISFFPLETTFLAQSCNKKMSNFKTRGSKDPLPPSDAHGMK